MHVSNIDTLYTRLDIKNYEAQIKPFLENLIRIQSENPGKEFESSFQGVKFVTRPERTNGHWHAIRIWHYFDNNPQAVAFDWRFNERRSTKQSTWSIELDFGSTTCWSMPFADLWKVAISTLQNLVADGKAIEEDEEKIRSRVSRVDIAIDTDMFNFEVKDRESFLSRSRQKGEYTGNEEILLEEEVGEFGQTVLYHKDTKFTGFTFGKGDLMARVYNKHFEISNGRSYKKDKSFFKKIWDTHGWNQSKDVWRIEFQIRRESLRQFYISGDDKRTFADASAIEAMTYVQSLLPYLLTKWLTYRVPSKNKNHAEWKIDPRWEQLAEQSVKKFGINDRIRLKPQFDTDELAKSLKGYLVSYAVAYQEPLIQNIAESLFHLLGNTFGYKNQTDMIAFLNQEIQEKAATNGIQLHKPNQEGNPL